MDGQQRSEDDINSHIIINIIKANKTLQEKIKENANPPSNVINDWSYCFAILCCYTNR